MLETVKIESKENKRGWVIINKSDMTKDDILFSDAKPKAKKKAAKDE